MGRDNFNIFSLGTNNWQSPEEFAPGSGILHESHHDAFNDLPDVRSFSIWPSPVQKSKPDRPDYRVFELAHDIPICESVGPVSSYRWHSMSEDEVAGYNDRLLKETSAYIDHIDSDLLGDGEQLNLFIAHHCFVNPTILAEINARRVAAGKARVPLVVFAHGTALKMFQNEQAELDEYPMRFLTWMQELGTFAGTDAVDAVFAIADAQKDTFSSIFPEFPADRVVVTPNGYNQGIFRIFEPDEVTRAEFLPTLLTKPYEGCEYATSVPVPADDIDRIVVFTGRFADWKRIDVVIKAAAIYEKQSSERIATFINGTGPTEDQKALQDMAHEMGLKRVFFLGPQTQDVLAKINFVSDVGVYPSKDEPFGLVLLECMACGTPVIGAASGGPLDFVNESNGVLIDEDEDHDVLARRLADAVLTALRDDWKSKKGPSAAQFARENYSLEAQCRKIFGVVEELV